MLLPSLCIHSHTMICAEEKQALLADANNRGYTPFAEETLDPGNQSRGDTKEGFYFGRCAGQQRAHTHTAGQQQQHWSCVAGPASAGLHSCGNKQLGHQSGAI